MDYFRVKDWRKLYENNRTKDMKVMQWIPVPNKHDGEGFGMVMAQENGVALYGAWHLILQVASKGSPRGCLRKADGTIYTAKAIATKTRADEKIIDAAIAFLSHPQVGWLERVVIKNEQEPAGEPQEPAGEPQEPARKGMEGKEEEGTPKPPMGACEAELLNGVKLQDVNPDLWALTLKLSKTSKFRSGQLRYEWVKQVFGDADGLQIARARAGDIVNYCAASAGPAQNTLALLAGARRFVEGGHFQKKNGAAASEPEQSAKPQRWTPENAT